MNTIQSGVDNGTVVDRRQVQREASVRGFQLNRGGNRMFGIGYGHSSGYARMPSYVGQSLPLFRCR
jgi:hypothetical protein